MTKDITNCVKITYTTTADAMWRRFMSRMIDIMWDTGYRESEPEVRKVAEALIIDVHAFVSDENVLRIRKLFSNGYASLLMDDTFIEEFEQKQKDKRVETIFEINIFHHENKYVTIYGDCIEL